jgi:hypothetical protein
MTTADSRPTHDGDRGKPRKGPLCGGKLHGRDGTCTQPAGWGTDHAGAGRCKLHGGCAPSGRIAALNEQAQRLLYKHDAAPVADPLEALQRLAGRALALEETIGQLVNNLTSIRYEGGEEGGAEQLRAEVAVLERAMDRCGRLLVDIAKLNIEERLAKVTEQQAELTMTALAAALGEMGLGLEKQREAKTRLARHLRAVPAA